MNKIDFIITAYNAEDTIERAILSCFDEKYFDVLVHVVDDCSEDDTLGVLQRLKHEYGDKINLIINKVNVGPGVSRNTALKQIREGAYLSILDGDDQLRNTFFSMLDYHLSDFPADVYLMKYNYVNEKSMATSPGKNVFKVYGYLNAEQKESLLYNNSYSCAKVFSYDLIKNNDIEYGDYRVYEDLVFVTKALLMAKTAYYINHALVNIYVYPNSATRTIINNEHVDCWEKALNQVKDLEFETKKGYINYLCSMRNRSLGYMRKSTDASDAYDRFITVLQSMKQFNHFTESSYIIGNDHNDLKRFYLNPKKVKLWKRYAKYKKKLLRISSDYAYVYNGQKRYTVLYGFDYQVRGSSQKLLIELINSGVEDIKILTNDYSVDIRYRVKPYTLQHYYILSNAKTVYLESWVDVQARFSKNSEVIQMWHGLPIKKMHNDASVEYRNEKLNKQIKKWDKLLYSNEIHKKLFMSCFGVKEKVMKEALTPLSQSVIEKGKIDFRENYGIPKDKKIIAYLPTWRESWKEQVTTDELIDFEAMKIPDDEFWIVSLHKYVKNNMYSFKQDGKIIDGSKIDTAELLSMTDVLITDYSSVIFDFNSLGKAFYFIQKDFESYSTNRGLYEELVEDFQDITSYDEQQLRELIDANKHPIKNEKYKYTEKKLKV